MSSSVEVQTMMISLSEVTVGKLLSMRSSQDETVNKVINRIIANRTKERLEQSTKRPTGTALVPPLGAKYGCEVLGRWVYGSTLPKLFANVVDTMNDVAPDSMQRFAEKRAYSRRYISRHRNQVYDHRADLGVMKTRSGWWISTNVGVADVVRGLKALCAVAGLSFGSDIRFTRL